MKKVLPIIIFLLLISTLTSCGESEYIKVTAKEAKDMMVNSEVIILDVREQFEYDAGHIEGAVLLPLGNINSNAEKVLTDKNQTILVYCRSGRRSKEAALKLLDLGYKNVYDFGGITDWPYELV